MSTSPNQLFLLADHIKLSLLERQRAVALNLQGSKQDGHITRALDTLRDGIENLHKQQRQLSSTGDDTADLAAQTTRLQTQYAALSAQFDGPSAAVTAPSLNSPNDPALARDFEHARRKTSKSVRFRDDPNAAADDDDDDDEAAAHRAALFDPGSGRYRDNDDDAHARNDDDAATAALSNQQIHAYHAQALRDQDSQLDTLGHSVRWQRALGLQMGEELDEHVEMLTDVEAGVDRHGGALEGANRRLKTVARKARENWSWLVIGCLILTLVLLIALT